MLKANHGKLLIYSSNVKESKKRLRSVSAAVEKIAKMWNLSVEVIAYKGGEMPIYVYYRDSKNEPVPLYCDKDGYGAEQVHATLRNMPFVLSFHSKYSFLKKTMKAIIQFS